MPQNKPIIVIKKKGGHGGHHGGAWKVAYADFVTAMMSLFIVLWLMNTSTKVRQAVAGYFNDPKGNSAQTGSDQSGTSDNLAPTENNVAQLKQKIEEAIRQMNDLKSLQNQIQITITPEGLRIELLETKDGTFFDTGSARLNDHGRELLEMLAQQLGQVPNRVSIEGHTDAQPYASTDGYGNWELSADRANAARRAMQSTGLRKDQVSQVRGYADQKLRVPSNPMDPSNRRISLIVQYVTVDAPPVPAGPEPPGKTAPNPQPANPGPPTAANRADKTASTPPAPVTSPAPKPDPATPPVPGRPTVAKPAAGKPLGKVATAEGEAQKTIAGLLARLHRK
ncbi:MAG: flagellar motor protein MotB [Acidobacteriaceae bacterium]